MGERVRYRNFVYDSGRWDGFEFRDGDIVISTPAKCGTTWMQMLCALLVFRTPDLPAPLADLSPWFDMNLRPLPEVVAALEAQRHRRFIKTHTPLDGLPVDDRVSYVGVFRDPRDVALSWDNHMANMDLDRLIETRLAAVGADDLEEMGATGPPPPPPEDPRERFWIWMEGDVYGSGVAGLTVLAAHARGFWERRDEPGVHLFHYSDLKADLAGEMARLAGALGLDPPDPGLVDAARFEAMKARADVLAPNVEAGLWHSNDRFFDQARSGGWQALLDDADRRRYDALAAGLGPPDFVAWLHGGRAAVTT